MKDTISFYSLGLSQRVIESINEMGFEEPTPIQEQTIPLAMEGCDLIGQAHTGTGKTAAFGIPMVERFQERSDTIQGLVVTPTRELAVQVAEELNRIGQFKGIRALPIYGGQDINRQLRALGKRPNIIVGTPGRLLDHIRRKTIRLNGVQIVVLDEADEMLNMGFIDDVRAILREIPHEHQTLLFSATMPIEILELSHKFMQAPELITIFAKEMTVESTEQFYMEVQERQKVEVLCRLLDLESPELAIIFVRTKRRVDELAGALGKRGYSAEGIHGDLTQSRRDSVMQHFREGSIDILVATDVAARGLDITGVTHVYNFDIPQDAEGYVHRIGRTGRVGKTGEALTFVTPWETDQLKTIEKMTRRKMVRKPVPSMTEAMVGQQRLTVDKLLQVVSEGELQQYKRLAEEMLDENDSVTLLSAALKMLTREPDTTPVQLSQEAPSRGNRPRGFNPQSRPKNRGPRRDGGQRSQKGVTR